MRSRNLLIYFLIALFIIALDQVSKLLVQRLLFEGEKVSVIGNFLYFRLVFNTGGAMGTQIGPSWVYLILTFVALAVIIRYFLTVPGAAWHVKTSLATIFGGAVGNLIDRVIYGRVIDFIDMDFPDIPFLYIQRWFTYNVADAAITVGLIIFIIGILIRKKERPAAAEAGDPEVIKVNGGNL
jgi:signal peptidase II